MAEALVNAYIGDEWTAFSAGAKPSGWVHPLAIKVLAELGIDASSHFSKPISRFQGNRFDRVITLCEDSENSCPVWIGPEEMVHMPFIDPAMATGSETFVTGAFRQVRDMMKEQILSYLLQS